MFGYFLFAIRGNLTKKIVCTDNCIKNCDLGLENAVLGLKTKDLVRMPLTSKKKTEKMARQNCIVALKGVR